MRILYFSQKKSIFCCKLPKFVSLVNDFWRGFDSSIIFDTWSQKGKVGKFAAELASLISPCPEPSLVPSSRLSQAFPVSRSYLWAFRAFSSFSNPTASFSEPLPILRSRRWFSRVFPNFSDPPTGFLGFLSEFHKPY